MFAFDIKITGDGYITSTEISALVKTYVKASPKHKDSRSCRGVLVISYEVEGLRLFFVCMLQILCKNRHFTVYTTVLHNLSRTRFEPRPGLEGDQKSQVVICIDDLFRCDHNKENCQHKTNESN